MNNIILVCDDEIVAQDLKTNLMLLRKLDYIYTCDFLNAEKFIAQNKPQIVVVYAKSEDNRVIDFVPNIKVPVFFITDKISDEYILNLYEAGIYDYITLSQSKAERLIKIMKCLKYSNEHKKLEQYSKILEQIGILEQGEEFYSKKYTSAIFKNLIENYSQNNIPGLILAIAPDIEEKNKCRIEFLATILKQNLRENDIIGLGKDCVYVLLPETGIQGGLDVYDKIKKTMKHTCGISAGIVKLIQNSDYDDLIKNVDETLNDALNIKNSVVVYEKTPESASLLEAPNGKKTKNFKLFRKVFSKKLESVISPIFYQKQKIAEQRLFEVDINQYCNENKSQFSLKKANIHSLFEITYPGAAKINIDIYKNFNTNNLPERLSYDLSQINEKLISDLLEKFIVNFQKNDRT